MYDISRPMKEMAMMPWKIKELPGRSPDSQWPESLEDLNDRLKQLEPMAAWSEPIFNKDGKDVYTQAEAFIYKTIEQKKDLIKSKAEVNELKKTDEVMASALSALIGLSVLSADYSRILSLLLLIYEVSESYPEGDSIISNVQESMVLYLNQLKSLYENTKSFHHLAQGSIYGCILMPNEATMEYNPDSVSSLTTDGTYLYVYWCSGRGLFKIGTGENGTLAGRVYLHKRTELTGSLTWVYLKNKIYARCSDQALGVITIVSPDTLQTEGNLSLYCEGQDVLNNPICARYNKRYPIITDGAFLYIIVMDISTRERKLRENAKEEIDSLKEKDKQQQKEKQENEKNENKESSEVNAEDPQASIASKKSQMLFGKSSGDNPDQPNPPATNEGDSVLKVVESLKEAKTCDFYLFRFDTDLNAKGKTEVGKFSEASPEAIELFESFSSFFTLEDCCRAIQINSDDMQAAAAWLVEEGGQSCKNIIKSNKKILLAQSEIINDKLNNRNEQDIQVKDDSILFPGDICENFWTLNKDQLALNKYYRNTINTKVFSINEEDISVIFSEFEQEEFLKKSKEAIKKKDVQHLFSDDSCEEDELRSPDLKRSSQINQDNSQPPPQSTNHDLAMKLYEKVVLKGSYLKSIKDVKLLDYEMNLTYDHLKNKFYGLVHSESTKVILVAQDLSQMKKSCFEHQKPIDDFLIPEKEEGKESKETLVSLVHKALEFFMKFENKRFDLPWRWRRWTTVFANANDASVIKNTKLTKRFEKIRDHELNNWRRKFGLEQLTISNKTKKNKKPKPTPTPAPTYSSYIANQLATSSSSTDNFKDVPVRIEEKKINAFCISGDTQTLKGVFKFLEKTSKSCFGNVQNKKSDSCEANYQIVLSCLKQLTYWIRVSDIIEDTSAYQTKDDLIFRDKVGDYLLHQATENITDEKFKENEEYFRLLWVAIINGFEIFYRSSESQFK